MRDATPPARMATGYISRRAFFAESFSTAGFILSPICGLLTLATRGTHVDRFDDFQRRARVAETRLRLASEPDVVQELCELDFPRAIDLRIFADHGIGRSHLRTHLVMRQALDAVAPPETFEVQLAGTAVN